MLTRDAARIECQKLERRIARGEIDDWARAPQHPLTASHPRSVVRNVVVRAAREGDEAAVGEGADEVVRVADGDHLAGVAVEQQGRRADARGERGAVEAVRHHAASAPTA